MTAHGHFHRNEFNTRDAEKKARAFYGKTLGWTFAPTDMGDGHTSWTCMMGDQPVGRIFTMTGPDFEGMPEHWFTYVAVSDIDNAVKEAKAAGATIHREPWDVPEVGRIAIVGDPNGAVMGWMTPAPMPQG